MSCRVWPSSDHPGDELSDSELEHRQAQANRLTAEAKSLQPEVKACWRHAERWVDGYGSEKIAWPPTLRHRIAGSPLI